MPSPYRIDDAQVRDVATGAPLRGLVGQQVQIVFRDTTTPAAILDETSSPISGSLLTVNPSIEVPRFWINTTTPADLYLDWLDPISGARGPVLFEKVLRDSSADSATSSAASAASSLASRLAAEAAAAGAAPATWGTLGGKPDTFPPSGHSHVRAEISDASTVGRAVLGATDQQTARAAIGAGTGNGTSNLALGTTATTAAAGNHLHAQYVDSAQAADIADERIALSGGTGGGGGSVYAWVYRSGAYPTLPTTAPAGVRVVMAIGPLQPSVLPSWIGNGPTQVPATYEYNGGLA